MHILDGMLGSGQCKKWGAKQAILGCKKVVCVLLLALRISGSSGRGRCRRGRSESPHFPLKTESETSQNRLSSTILTLFRLCLGLFGPPEPRVWELISDSFCNFGPEGPK